jgi:hypothetical protein
MKVQYERLLAITLDPILLLFIEVIRRLCPHASNTTRQSIYDFIEKNTSIYLTKMERKFFFLVSWLNPEHQQRRGEDFCKNYCYGTTNPDRAN